MKNTLLLTALVATLSACVAGPVDSDPGTESPDKIALNSLSPNSLLVTNLGLSTLTNSSVSAVAATDKGRQTLGYIIGCALPANAGISVTVAGTNYTFPGAYGLATYWLHSPLTAADRGLVSACVLSRVNYYGVAVSISMRGQSSTLATVGTETTNYFLEEGAFYGDILSGTGSQAIHTCDGKDEISQPTAGDLAYRKCTVPASGGIGTLNQCNFTYDGHCADVCSTTVGGAGYYDSCNGFTNTVTTFVQ